MQGRTPMNRPFTFPSATKHTSPSTPTSPPNLPTQRPIALRHSPNIPKLFHHQITNHPPKHHTPMYIQMRMILRVQIILPRRIRPDLVAIVCARDIEIDMTGAGGVGRLYHDITLNSQILFNSRRRSGSVITTSQGSYKNLIIHFK